MKEIQVFSPATIGNFIIGFDVLGACLKTNSRQLGDVLTISDKKPTGYSAIGEFAYRLPSDNNNLVIKTAEFFNQQFGHPVQKLNFVLSKNLPIGSGLGSSASSIVATLFGLNEWYQQPFSMQQLLTFSAEIEGTNSGSIHYDNVAPCLLGGLQLISPNSSTPCQTIPFFDFYYFALCFPDIEITTRSAREILPTQISLQQSVTMQSRLSTFIAACFNGNDSLAMEQMQDDIIVPARRRLIPHYDQAEMLALSQGALGFSISGSGPACFAICSSAEQAKSIADNLLEILKQGPHAFSCVAQLDTTGARIL